MGLEETNPIGCEFIYIPPGEFWMGSSKSEDESPRHRVRLTRGYYMMTTPVTQGQWESLMKENPSCFKKAGPSAPVENVSWKEIQIFIERLNELDPGNNYRLPTEAEWEYACRAGTKTAFYSGPITDPVGRDPNLDKVGWYRKNSGGSTHPVGQKEPNNWGVYDMHGNVWEWCNDWYGSYPDGSVTDPTGPATGWDRVCRGGSWISIPVGCRSARRIHYMPSNKINLCGFRLVKLVKKEINPQHYGGDQMEPICIGTMEFKYIPPGVFWMGSPDDEQCRSYDEIRHRVRLTRGYYMMTTPVTQGQWESLMKENPSWFKERGSKLPVETVSWEDCQKFIQKMNQQFGLYQFRLPTEAEWEYACRAGTETAFYTGNCLETTQANFDGDYPFAGCPKGEFRGRTTPVKTFPPNPWGLYDMHGNVMEWMQDWYSHYSVLTKENDIKGPETGVNKVIRGGSWYNNASMCRSAFRCDFNPNSRSDAIGLRLILNVIQEDRNKDKPSEDRKKRFIYSDYNPAIDMARVVTFQATNVVGEYNIIFTYDNNSVFTWIFTDKQRRNNIMKMLVDQYCKVIDG